MNIKATPSISEFQSTQHHEKSVNMRNPVNGFYLHNILPNVSSVFNRKYFGNQFCSHISFGSDHRLLPGTLAQLR